MRESIKVVNIIIANGNLRDTDKENIFQDEDVVFSRAKDIPELLVEFGFFESKSQAKKAGRIGPIPDGFTKEFKATKIHRIFIWNPSEK